MNHTHRIQQMTRGRKILLCILIAISITMILFNILMEGTHTDYEGSYGDYFTSFSWSYIDWRVIGYFLLAYFLLLLPWYLYCFGKKENYQGFSIFPYKSGEVDICGSLLTIWSVFTGGLFTFTYLYYAWDTFHRELMTLDEYLLVILGYLCCIVFWGIVDLIYFILYLFRRKKEH